jgi:hypothetical protein
MRKLPEVEEAKALMTEAMDWSVIRWLWEKRNVREAADLANAALDQLNKKTKARWSEELKAAYRELVTVSHKSQGRGHRQNSPKPEAVDPQVKLHVEQMKQADDAAHQARMDAEETFDEAERQMDVSMAREGCQKAIDSWRLHEKAIRQAETLVAKSESES